MAAVEDIHAADEARWQRLGEFWSHYRRNRGAVAGLAVFTALVLMALGADIIAPYSPIQQYRDHALQPPFWQAGGSYQFLLGTDAVGRDLLSRLIHGARYSLAVGCIVIAISMTIGVLFGLLAGYFRGLMEEVIMRVMDIIWSFPGVLLGLMLVTLLGPGLFNVMIAVAIEVMPRFVRVTRAQFIAESAKEYVTATRVVGAGPTRLMFRTVLPNCMAPIIVNASLTFSVAVLSAAGLSFLGLGAQAPTPEWGAMLAEAREFILRAWWVVTFPGLAIVATVLSVNLMGDGLRDALDPKLKR